ncbi:NAD(P)-dependent oxidoreductase [Candidatus Symbiopectobacterium sp. NZEC135]|uniref:NAD(P)-dependent oxidoreductase n=1 Tax=Candidatus Symbiopectobacterium sp. NZEC135 TaxID=2820471 RepID=UPI002226D5A7|nr:NAD(P)-dependent oxidoreductase [Candidatus Symbiopectobacterium sp. NZEC135]MCW2481121.1 NAD(P)-dependent oxidoreductase [Candidatus Symbiopectobacterium sp. NZEC135]
MKVALIGATGMAGSEILKELVARGHQVTAIARNTTAIPQHDAVTPLALDVSDRDGLSAALRGHDAAISAVRFQAVEPSHLIEAVSQSGVTRYLVVGGAGSLEVAGTRLLDTPDFPDAYRPEATRGAEFLAALRQHDELSWSFLSPSALFTPGPRTGHFRLGKDTLLVDEAGNSAISAGDFSVALVDELEQDNHLKSRFTVGY